MKRGWPSGRTRVGYHCTHCPFEYSTAPTSAARARKMFEEAQTREDASDCAECSNGWLCAVKVYEVPAGEELPTTITVTTPKPAQTFPPLTPTPEGRVSNAAHLAARNAVERVLCTYRLAPGSGRRALEIFADTGAVFPATGAAAAQLATLDGIAPRDQAAARWLTGYCRIRIASNQAEPVPAWPLALTATTPVDAAAGRPVQTLLFVH